MIEIRGSRGRVACARALSLDIPPLNTREDQAQFNALTCLSRPEQPGLRPYRSEGHRHHTGLDATYDGWRGPICDTLAVRKIGYIALVFTKLSSPTALLSWTGAET